MTVEFEYDGDTLDEIFGGDQTHRARAAITSDYAAPVNYGGDPHWPPLTPMVKWTNRMGWENYGMRESMNEGDMWEFVDDRRDANDPLPAAYLLASHIASEGTEAMEYASDAFSKAQSEGGSWAAANLDETTPLDEAALKFANWTMEMAEDNLIQRVSSASTGKLLQQMQPAELV